MLKIASVLAALVVTLLAVPATATDYYVAANDDSYTVEVDSTTSLNVLENDESTAGALRIIDLQGPDPSVPGVTLSITSDQLMIDLAVAADAAPQTLTFHYSLENKYKDVRSEKPATVTLTIKAKPVPPVVKDDAVTLVWGDRSAFDPLSNDVSPDGRKLRICGTPRYSQAVEDDFTHFRVEATRSRLNLDLYAPKRTKSSVVKFKVCDGKFVVNEKLTVSFQRPPDPVVTRVKSGVFDVYNPNPRVSPIYFMCGKRDSQAEKQGYVQGRATRTFKAPSSVCKVWFADFRLPYGKGEPRYAKGLMPR